MKWRSKSLPNLLLFLSKLETFVNKAVCMTHWLLISFCILLIFISLIIKKNGNNKNKKQFRSLQKTRLALKVLER